MNCPDCSAVLKGTAYKYKCGGCGADWKAVFKCDVCGSIPAVIESCGSVSFFCENCRKPKSREDMVKFFTKA